MSAGPVLREDQLAAVAGWLESRRGCVIMPTGTGKTEVALHLIAQCSQSILIVAPVRDLMYQWNRQAVGPHWFDSSRRSLEMSR